MTIEIGKVLDTFEITGLLGAGGMGEVYRARDPRLSREVAIKVLSNHLADTPEARSRFERESKAVAALSHPNIITIYDCGIQDDVSYAVTELLEGENLGDRIGRTEVGSSCQTAPSPGHLLTVGFGCT